MPAMHLIKTANMAVTRRLILLLITLTGAYLRFSHLGAQSLWIDEGFSLVTAYGIMAKGIPMLPSGMLDLNYMPVHYLLALGLALFNEPEIGGRFFPALLGTLLIPLSYLFTKQLFRSPGAALLSAGLMACLSYEVGWSRQARFYVPLQLAILMAMYLFLRYLDDRGKRKLVMALGLGVLAAITHPAGQTALLFMAMCAMLDHHILRGLRPWIRLHGKFLLIAGMFACACLVAASFLDINANFLQPWQHIKSTHSYDYNKLYVFFFRMQFGFLLVWALLGLLYGCFRFPRAAIPLLLVLLLYYVTIAWFTTLFHFRYTLPIVLFMPSLISFGCVSIIQQIKNRPFNLARTTGVVIVLLLYSSSHITARLSLSPRPYPDLGYTAPTAEWRGACAWIAKDHAAERKAAGDLITVSTFPMFHDLYLGCQGTKYFLPHSLSGFPGHDRENDIHTDAKTLSGVHHLQHLSGAYLFIDSFGIRMLTNQAIKDHLTQIPPDYIAPGAWNFDVYVWRLPLHLRH